jgi:hypothetical protein
MLCLLAQTSRIHENDCEAHCYIGNHDSASMTVVYPFHAFMHRLCNTASILVCAIGLSKVDMEMLAPGGLSSLKGRICVWCIVVF